MLKAKSSGILRPLLPLRRRCAARAHRRRSALGALLLVTLLAAGLAAAGLLLGPAGPAQAQDGQPPAPENLSCTANTEQVVFLWEAAEWSGGEPAHFDYELTLPSGQKEAARVQAYAFTRNMVLRKSGSFQAGQEFRLRVKTLYETPEGREAVSAEATLTCYVGGARTLTITPNHPTREYGGADDLSYSVGGLVDGDAAGDVVSGTLTRTPGDDAGSYAISLDALAVASQYATKYALPAAPAVAAYTITPKPVAYTATAPSRAYDGTTAVPGPVDGGFADGAILSGDTVTVTGGSYAAADAATGVAVVGLSAGGAEAGNYDVTVSVSGDITPAAITAVSGVSVNARLDDGTTTATFDTGSAQGTGVLSGELADFRAGGLAVSGAFPAATPGSYDVDVTYSLQDQGGFKAANYTLSASVAAASLRGELRDDASLKALGISAGTLTFSPYVTAYAVEVPHTVGSVTLTPAASRAQSAVTVNGGDPATAVALNYGQNVINVAVTAGDGVTTQTYVVTVTRKFPTARPGSRLEPAPTPTPQAAPSITQAPDDATLKTLGISAGTLNFSPDTTTYAVDVAATVGSVTFTPAPSHPHATVTVNGGDPGAEVYLNYGENAINVAVTAADGVTTQTYVVTVARARSENVQYTAVANLEVQGNRDLALTGLAAPESIAVYPQFRRDHYNYRLVAPEDLTELVVTGRFTSPYRNTGSGRTAYVMVAEDLSQAEAKFYTYPPDRNGPGNLVSILHASHWEYPETIPLKAGEPTTAQIGIYKWKSGWTRGGLAKNSYKRVYTLTVTRGLPGNDDATLHDLTISKGALDYDPETTAYTVDVPYTTDRVTFLAVPFHPNAEVTVNGVDPSAPVALDYNAPNPVTVVVTAPDGVTTRTYAVTVNRTFPTRPNPSGALRLMVQENSIAVTWRGPGTGDPPDYYVARLEDADDHATDQRLGADARAATFDNLQSGAAYTVSVRSGNDGGESDWSEAVTVVTGAGVRDAGCQPASGDDYDADDDGLIEVCSLAQLYAIRFDRDNGDGSASGSAIPGAGASYEAAFPGITQNGPGCPDSGCKGYELTADLDFDTNGNGYADAGDYGGTVEGGYVNDGKGWLPIGKYAAVFDGNGHTISNLYINDGQRRGLFHELAATGVIRNVTLKNVDVSGGGDRVGALVGWNHGTISNAGVSGSVSGRFIVGGLVGGNQSTITDSYSSGKVRGTERSVGGLVGYNNLGRIVRSWSTANVTAASGTRQVGGLVGYSVYYWQNKFKPSIVASYATGRVSGNGIMMGGLVGRNEGEIFASYATGDVSAGSGGYVGGLAGKNTGPITASYALGAVSGGGMVGGLVGHQESPHINGHRCAGCSLPNARPGQVDRSGVTASYWNSQAAGQTATVAMHLNDGRTANDDRWETMAAGTRRTTAELRGPTDYTGLYVHWDNLRDNRGDSYAWDFGTSEDFPVLRDVGPSVAAQRAQMPDPPDSTERPVNRPEGEGIDYDQDDDGLIEVRSLDQLHAIRHDLAGSGKGYWRGYAWGYPNPMPGMGCPRDGCIGYELVTDLDFDTNGNGEIDPGDHYWNGVHLLNGSEECRSWYGGPTRGSCDGYFGNDGEGWRPIAVQGTDDTWRGVFEGNGHTIRNLYINTLDTPFTEAVLNRKNIYGLPTTAGDGYHNDRGLFDTIAYSGVVRNLRLENVNVSGKNSVGALAGRNGGIISNVHVTGAVSGINSVGGLAGLNTGNGYIVGSSSRASVAGRKTGGKDVGGLVGLNEGVIQASYARGAVSGWANNTGGLVGGNAGGTIKASYATGPVSIAGQRAGGLAGGNGGRIVASYATGAATADGGLAGGLLGRLRAGAVIAAYWDTQASGHATSPAGSGKTTAELQQPTGYAGIYADWNVDLDLDGSGDDPWEFGTASQYPVLKYGGLSPADQRAPFTAQALDLPRVGDGPPPTPNQAPTVTGSLDDVTVASGGGTKEVSLTGLFDDADGDALTITAHTLTITAEPPPDHDGTSYIEVVTGSVSADQSSLTLTGQVPGTATVTVTANDGKGGAASADFVATVASGTPPEQEQQQQEPATSGDYTALIAQMYQWREDPQWRHQKAHTDRWDRALLAFGETVADTTLTPMTAAEAQAFADRGWERWVEVAAALRELENRAPTVSSALADVSGLEVGDTLDVALTGVFDDADGDALTITAASSDETKATVTVSADHSTLTLTGAAEGTATITVIAQDPDGERASDAFEVEVVEQYAALIAQMYQWREDPQWRHQKSHTDRWDRALLAFGETVADSSLTPMTAAQAQALADQDWGERWVPVAAALWEIEGGGQQGTPNRAPTVANAIGDATIVNQSGTRQVSLSGVFDDADNDALSVTAASSDEAKATVSVAADYSTLTVTARSRGTATVTVTADDGNGGTVEDAFTVTVKAAPVVASAIADVSGLEVDATQDVSLSGVFSDADGDALTITASSSDETKATATVASDGSSLTLAGVAEGTATITVTAQDSDGNPVSDVFDVSVAAPQQQQQTTPNRAPTVSEPIADATIVNQSGTRQVSLSGVFDDADGDSLTITAASSDGAVATVPVASDGSSLTVSAQARGTAVITVTASDGNGGTVSDSFSVTVKAAPVVASAIADVSGLEVGDTQDVSLAGVFSDADGDALTTTAASSDEAKLTVTVASDGSKLTLAGVAEGTTTITVTAQDSDGNAVSDAFQVEVAAAEAQDEGPPTPVTNLSCDARTDRVTFRWDEPQWSGAEVYAYDYVVGRPDGQWKLVRLQGHPVVNEPGEYQAGQEASISVKAVYELADGSEVSSAAASLTCTVGE